MKYTLLFLILVQASHFLLGDSGPYNLLLADHTTRKYSIMSKSGEIVWERPGKGLFEAWALWDGSLLLADREMIQKVVPGITEGEEDKILWTYKYGQGIDLTGLPSGMIYTCTPLRNGNILVIESGTYQILELNSKGKILRRVALPEPSDKAHQQALRLARKTETGTYLVCYMLDGKILEIDGFGEVLRTIDVNPFIDVPGPSAYEAVPLERGRMLVSLGPSNKVIILDAEGKLEWELSSDDLPEDWNFYWITKVFPMKNGNLMILNYCKGKPKVKAFEITLEKRIVWQLTDPRIKGLTSLQLLTDDFKGLGLPKPIKKRQFAISKYPDLKGLKILCVKRTWPGKKPNRVYNKGFLAQLGFPVNHLSMSSMKKIGQKNEIGVFDVESGKYSTLYKPTNGGWVGHLNLHWDGKRFLFTQGNKDKWEIFEMNIDGSGLRQVSNTPIDVDSFEPCYLPDGRIVFESNAPLQGVPCWHGIGDKYIANIYVMNPDGSGMRRLAFDQDHDYQPSVRNNGQVVYCRWDYTGPNRDFNRPLMSMNPDGTNQRSIYGSNSYYPNGMYSMSELPGKHGEFLGIVGGYHGSHRSGLLTIFDLNKGQKEDEGLVLQISGTSTKLPVRHVDMYTKDYWPEFLTPSPITADVFLSSVWMDSIDNKIGIYLADRDDNVIQLFEEQGMALLEPIPIISRPLPPVIPERVDLSKQDATVYIQDVYAGPGLKNVPRESVKSLRVIAYDFGYDDLGGQNKIGLAGPWDAMRILGTTPVEKDGSAIFKVPANTPIALQTLDSEGKAVQLMRSWMTAMPGEFLSCVGCHESSSDVPLPRRTLASNKAPLELDEWYGPQRGFDFERELQPVLNRYCVSCHDEESELDLREESLVKDYIGTIPGRLDTQRLHDDLVDQTGGRVLYTQAYEALLPYVRRVNVADAIFLLDPGEYHADTSELVQILQNGHYGIEMDDESWSRLITWIDLNAPCHGTWTDVFNRDTPCCAMVRRQELAELYGGAPINPETIPETSSYDDTPVSFEYEAKEDAVDRITGQLPDKLERRIIHLGQGQSIELVQVKSDLWMSSCEVSNGAFSLFDPEYDGRFYWKRALDSDPDEKGVPLNHPDQPAIRVSWDRAMEFCKWLSDQTGMKVSLPTENEWEYACLAGNSGRFGFPEEDFSKYENLADETFATAGIVFEENVSYANLASGTDLVVAEGVDLADKRFDDGALVTAPVGSYKPNALGMHDMHGNVAEWTMTETGNGEHVVKGGSFLDRPDRAAVDQRYVYPSWQNVYNVGFRIVVRHN